MAMQLIDRYVYDVTRRLPEKERGEVKLELETTINDMLPDNPAEQDVIGVLTQLGAPKKLAEQYRQGPRYLISPAMYDTYITVLKNVVIVVACVCACVGAFVGVGSLDASASAGDVFSAIVREAAGFGFEGVLMALFWVTIGFVIADRSKGNDDTANRWTVADLPAMPETGGVKIPRASTGVSAALTVLFAGLYVAFVNNGWFFGGIMFFNGTEIAFPFSQAALERAVPLVIGVSAAALVLFALKFYTARWNVKVCVGTVIYNACWLSAAFTFVSWPDLIDPNFLERMEQLIHINLPHLVENGTVAFFPYIFILFIISAAIDIGSAVWNTLKSRNS